MRTLLKRCNICFVHKVFFACAVCMFIGACRSARKQPGALAAANMAALEQTVDMENKEVDSDDVLQFEQEVLDLGEIRLGDTRELALKATNKTDRPLAVLDAYTSCHCTKVGWEKKPVPAGGETVFKIVFTAEQQGVFFKKIAVRHSAKPTPVTFAIQGVVK